MDMLLRIGMPVHCSDGAAGVVRGVVINPNTSAFEYIIVQTDGREAPHFVSRGHIQGISSTVTLDTDCAWLNAQPEPGQRTPDEVGLVTSNLENLCVADSTMLVQTQGGASLGQFAGVMMTPEYHISAVLLSGGGTDHVVISRVDPTSHEVLRVVTPAERQIAM